MYPYCVSINLNEHVKITPRITKIFTESLHIAAKTLVRIKIHQRQKAFEMTGNKAL